MNKPFFIFFLIAIGLTGCRKTQAPSDSIVSLQIRDRNGFSETISSKDRLKIYQEVDFLDSQPYEKVLRVYGKDQEGKSPSKISTYHDTGHVWQYLECIDGRAHGKFLQWHKNGKIKIEGYIIEGLAEFSEAAQRSWMFEGPCTVWDDQGNIEALFQYDRGQLDGNALYYHPSGKISKTITYKKGVPHGSLQEFNENGDLLKEILFTEGLKNGRAFSRWSDDTIQYDESYENGKLLSGSYFNKEGEKISEIKNGNGIHSSFHEGALYSTTQYEKGEAKGLVKIYDIKGNLKLSYQLLNGMKTGEEWEYYPSKKRRRKAQVTTHLV